MYSLQPYLLWDMGGVLCHRLWTQLLVSRPHTSCHPSLFSSFHKMPPARIRVWGRSKGHHTPVVSSHCLSSSSLLLFLLPSHSLSSFISPLYPPPAPTSFKCITQTLGQSPQCPLCKSGLPLQNPIHPNFSCEYVLPYLVSYILGLVIEVLLWFLSFSEWCSGQVSDAGSGREISWAG